MNTFDSSQTYDLAVIGAGTAGLVASFVASSLGAKVLCVEGERVGGECLWTGCVPSKTLIRSARAWEEIKRAEEFGVHVEKPRLVWSAVKLRIAAVRDEIKTNERAELAKSEIALLSGTARFATPAPQGHPTLSVRTSSGEQTVRAKKFILATGTRTRVPEIEGLRECGFLTHTGVYDLPNLPRSLVIIGGGPIACEFAQAFARFGTKVTMLQKDERILPREDGEISQAAHKMLEHSGVTIHCNAQVRGVRQDDTTKIVDFDTADGKIQEARGAQILVAVGKEVDFSSLDLETAGVKANENGLIVDNYLRTTARHIWACGDCVGPFLFTHVAEYQGKIAAQNALLPLKAKADYRVVPWTTFTDPEIAHLGLTEDEALAQEGMCRVWRARFDGLDRAIIDGATEGFLKVVTSGSGRILGAHIIGPSAGELIHNFVPAVRDGMLIGEFAEAIHVYPTLSEIAHRAGNEFFRDALDAPLARAVLKRIV